jgi:hypothetical protein
MGARSWSIEDVIDAADFRGELAGWWDRVRWLERCRGESASMGEADETALQEAVAQFRYERELITAEETENWLEARGVSLEDFTGHFVREYWACRVGDQLERAAGNDPSDSSGLRHLLRIELLLSPDFARMAEALGWRQCVLEDLKGVIPPASISEARVHFLDRLGDQPESCDGWCARLDRNPSWLEEMLAMEATFGLETARVLTPDRRERALQEMRVALTRVELEVLEVECLAAAREAILCVREDGSCLESVAREGGYPFRREEVLLEGLPLELHQRVLCAAAGEVLEPAPRGDGFQLWRVLRKSEPGLDDPLIQARVDRAILDQHFRELAAGRVQWLPGFVPP